MAPRIIGMLVVIGLLAALLYSSRLRPVEDRVSGFIEADEVRVGSRVGGRVKSVLTEEGKQVKAGELLVELEPYDLQERRTEALAVLAANKAQYEDLAAGFRKEQVAQAKAKRDQIAANLDKLRAGARRQEIAIAEASVVLAIAQTELAESEFKRLSQSYSVSAASANEVDQAKDRLSSATATLEIRRQQLDLLKEGTRPEDLAQGEAQLREADASLQFMINGPDVADVEAAKAAVSQAQAVADAIDKQIAELKISAPIDGLVEAVDLEPGDLVAANAPVLSILDTRQFWVRAYMPENRLNVQIGQKMAITVDSFPDRRFAGRVSFVSRQAEFMPSNVQTPEERSKQVFRIKVTLDEGLDVLRAGMAADVWLDPEKAP